MANEGLRKRGTCPVCGREFALQVNGKLPPHVNQNERDRAGFHPDCAGTGQRPT